MEIIDPDLCQDGTDILDLDIVGGHIITLEAITLNERTSYVIAMTGLRAEASGEYHEYYEYEVDLEDAILHFQHMLSHVGRLARS